MQLHVLVKKHKLGHLIFQAQIKSTQSKIPQTFCNEYLKTKGKTSLTQLIHISIFCLCTNLLQLFIILLSGEHENDSIKNRCVK